MKWLGWDVNNEKSRWNERKLKYIYLYMEPHIHLLYYILYKATTTIYQEFYEWEGLCD